MTSSAPVPTLSVAFWNPVGGQFWTCWPSWLRVPPVVLSAGLCVWWGTDSGRALAASAPVQLCLQEFSQKIEPDPFLPLIPSWGS